MFTRCPECKTIFRVTDEQLGAAGGRVRCGHCAAIFDARASLAERAAELQRHSAPEAQRSEPKAPAEDRTGPEPHAYATDYSEFLQPPAAPAPPHEDRPASPHSSHFGPPAAPTEPHGRDVAPQPHPDANAGRDHAATPEPWAEDLAPQSQPHTEAAGGFPAMPQPPEEEPRIDEPASPEAAEAAMPDELRRAPAASHADEPVAAKENQVSEDTAGAAIPAAPEHARTALGQEEEPPPPPSVEGPEQPPAAKPAEPVPSILEDDLQALARRRPRWRTFAWSLLVIGLLLAFGVQYVYFNRADLVRNAQLRPWLERACQWAGCTIPLAPDLNKLRFLNSTVMVDPQQDDRLLILATMVNTADFPQPYPLLEVRLTSLEGKVVAMRRFKPQEYLPDDIDAAHGLQPDTPLSVKLEVVRPQQSVSGYQFDFR